MIDAAANSKFNGREVLSGTLDLEVVETSRQATGHA
jgi:hypothetical protein